MNRVPLRRVGEKDQREPRRLSDSDYAAYINGEVVTIDGGEWLQGAGQFNDLLEVTEEQWVGLAEMTRKGKS